MVGLSLSKHVAGEGRIAQIPVVPPAASQTSRNRPIEWRISRMDRLSNGTPSTTSHLSCSLEVAPFTDL